MNNLFRLVFISGLGAVLLSSCARREAPPVPPPPAPLPRPADVSPMGPAGYVANASSIDLFVIEAARLAASRSGSARLLAIAATLSADHGGTSAQLSFAGRRLNLLPSASMLSRHRAMFEELSAAADFDAAWKRLMLRVHDEGIEMHGAFARGGSSPTLRPVAEMAFAAMRRHHQSLREL